MTTAVPGFRHGRRPAFSTYWETMTTKASTDPMPVLFVGHGSPMNAIEPNRYRQTWERLGRGLPRPYAILCISAHWQTRGTLVTLADPPRTIHDFGGFPRALHEMRYPAPGAPELARLAAAAIPGSATDTAWGLDHGAWCVLAPMFPAADVPAFQLSLDAALSPWQHFELAQRLTFLRRQGVLILASGNIVHNLGRLRFDDPAPFAWALEFDEWVRVRIESGDSASLCGYTEAGSAAEMSVPTDEHYLPLLYALALREPDEPVAFFNEGFDFGSVSMRSFVVGRASAL